MPAPSVADRAFRNRLAHESATWVADALISTEQRDALLARYSERQEPHPAPSSGALAPPDRKHLSFALPAIIIGLAGVLLCTGIILFYAANWRQMPPWIKFAQVLALVLGTYGAAFVLRLRGIGPAVLSRVLLIAGMVSYGAGIMLVAQIFHISAHPTNGVLTWAIGVLAMSVLMREPIGHYLALALVFVWNAWEVTLYGSVNGPYVLVLILFAWAFYRDRQDVGLAMCFFLLLGYFYQFNGHMAAERLDSQSLGDSYSRDTNAMTAAAWYVIVSLSQIPLGALLVAAGVRFNSHPRLGVVAKISQVTGWALPGVALILVSWPIPQHRMFIVFQPDTLIASAEWVLLTVAALAASLLLRGHPRIAQLLIAISSSSLVMLMLPLGNLSVSMVATHLGVLGLVGALLHLFGTSETDHAIPRFFAYFFAAGFIIVKAVGLLGFGAAHSKFFVAYTIGAMVFVLCIYLLNTSAMIRAQRAGHRFYDFVVAATAAATFFVLLYALSFKLPAQTSVLATSSVVLTSLGFFIGVATLLFLHLLRQECDRVPVLLALGLFVFGCITLLVTAPERTWVFYSIVGNAALFVYVAVLIYYATRVNSRALLNLAILGLVLQIVSRYFDVFWDLLSGSLLFFVTGILGIAFGLLLDRQRRRLLRRMKALAAAANQEAAR